MPYYYSYFSYLIFMLPALIVSTMAQASVKSNFRKYSKKQTQCGLTGADSAKLVLQRNSVDGINITPIRGNLTDNYDPRRNTISLSSAVYYNQTISAIGVAAHEAGHAVQHANNYAPMMIRSFMAPVTQFGSGLSMPLILFGFIFQMQSLVTFGILLYSLVVLFTIITLPVEFNASNTAIKTLRDAQILTPDELLGAKKVLRAAAMTYVASTFTALLALLRLILIYGGRDNGK